MERNKNRVCLSVCLDSGREGRREGGRLQASAKANRIFNQPAKRKEKKQAEGESINGMIARWHVALFIVVFWKHRAT